MVALKNINAEPKLTRYLVNNKLIKLKVIDVGAKGGFSPYWNTYKDCLEIVGFDPDINDCKKSNGKCLPYALSSDGKDKIFYEIRYSPSSGFYPPNTEFTNRLNNRDYLNIVNTVEMKTVTLDSLNLEPDFIKLDTEGSELDILQGGIKSLDKAVGVSTEVEFVEIFKEQPLFPDVDRFLTQHGFSLYDLAIARLDRLNPRKPITGMSSGLTGQIVQGQALYFRDLINEKDISRVLKLASLFELFNLKDCAIELLNRPETKEYMDLIEV